MEHDEFIHISTKSLKFPNLLSYSSFKNFDEELRFLKSPFGSALGEHIREDVKETYKTQSVLTDKQVCDLLRDASLHQYAKNMKPELTTVVDDKTGKISFEEIVPVPDQSNNTVNQKSASMTGVFKDAAEFTVAGKCVSKLKEEIAANDAGDLAVNPENGHSFAMFSRKIA